MTNHTVIAAERRDRAGKGTARQTRRDGRIPAVLYGNNQPPVMLSLPVKETELLSRKAGFFTHLFDINLGGESHKALARDAQRHPVTEALEHIDFLRVDEKTRIRVAVPVKFINQINSPGIKRGGVLNVVEHKLVLLCNAANIPAAIEVDLTGLHINDSIHAETLNLPEGATRVKEGNYTIASIAAPSAIRAEMREKMQAEAAAGAAGEAAPAEGAAAAVPAAGAKAAPAAAGAKAPAAGAKAAAPAAAAKPAAKK